MTGKTYATGKSLPPRSEWVPRVFRRDGMFYIIELPEDDDLANHARLNPGTQRIEDILGNQLWPPRPASVDTRPEGGDAPQIAAPFTSGAVPERQTPNPIPKDRHDPINRVRWT